jgi:transcriptional regulator with XRE-family HTH domain
VYNSKLRGLIRNSGLTQSEFASKIGLGDYTVSRIINNRTKAKDHQKEIIAKFFGKSINYLFKEADNGKRKDRRDNP